MPLSDDQILAENSVLLGKFIVAVKAAAADIVEEPALTLNHVGRMALAKRIAMDRAAANYARVILELAIARHPKLRADRDGIGDVDIRSIVDHYIDIFAAEGW